ncbi:hypothetical protein Mapa_001294 [Marchantia paleacea]|nr:hypothetical protein Mapa_001294 [Marchantia paleacea]
MKIYNIFNKILIKKIINSKLFKNFYEREGEIPSRQSGRSTGRKAGVSVSYPTVFQNLLRRIDISLAVFD